MVLILLKPLNQEFTSDKSMDEVKDIIEKVIKDEIQFLSFDESKQKRVYLPRQYFVENIIEITEK
jgi:hypothetical protein